MDLKWFCVFDYVLLLGGAELSLQTENVLINPKKYLSILLLLWIPKLCQLLPKKGSHQPVFPNFVIEPLQ